MSCTNAIVAMAVMGTSPSQLNRVGGIAQASLVAPQLTSRPEPCPYDVNFNLVTSLPWPTPDKYGNSFTNVAYNVAECNKMPINLSQPKVYGIYVGVMTLATAFNCFSVRFLNLLLIFSIFWHTCGSLVITFGVPGVAVSHLNKKMIWARFQPSNWDAIYNNGAPPGRSIYQGFEANNAINWGGNGISGTDHSSAAFVNSEQLAADSGAFIHHDNLHYLVAGANTGDTQDHRAPAYPYIFLCGMLMSQWCYTGYDASAHMSEETTNAARSGPIGIITTILVTFVFGLSYIVSVISSIQDYNNTLNGPLAVNYNPIVQIFWDACEKRYGNGRYAMGFWIIPLIAMFLCTVSSLTSNSRMLYAFSRDEAVPGSSIWHRIVPKLKIPVNAVLGMAVAAMLIALPCIKSAEAFGAVTSIAVIGLYISYIVPVVCRLLVPEEFTPGPFTLGPRLGKFVAIVATMWVTTICVIFVLPSTYPINMNLNFNYAIIAVRSHPRARRPRGVTVPCRAGAHPRCSCCDAARQVGVVLTYSMGTWFIPGPKPFNARRWFKGPHLEALEVAAEFGIVDYGPGASMIGEKHAKGELDPDKLDLPPVPLGV